MNLLNFLSRIEDLCKQRGVKRQIVYESCGVGKNFGISIRNGSEPSIGKVLALATELDCSIDYLLERTDNPQAHKTQAGSTVNNAPISGNFNSVGNSGNISVSTTEHTLDENEKALLEYYNALSPLDRAQLLIDVAKMSKKDKDT